MIRTPLHSLIRPLLLFGLLLAVGLGPLAVSADSDTNPISRISWQSELNVVYQLQWSTTLEEDDWHDAGDPITGNGLEMFVYLPAHDANVTAYRIVVQP